MRKKLLLGWVIGFLVFGAVGIANAISYVDNVISFTLGVPDDGAALDPDGILGAPDWNINLSKINLNDVYYDAYVNLGNSGVIIVEMTNWIENGSGYDLTVYEIGSPENINVWVSSNNSNWIDLGTGVSSTGPVEQSTAWLYEFSSVSTTPIKYIKLIDVTPIGNDTGADIDAIKGHYSSATVVPAPSSIFLLGSGLLSVAGVSRRKN